MQKVAKEWKLSCTPILQTTLNSIQKKCMSLFLSSLSFSLCLFVSISPHSLCSLSLLIFDSSFCLAQFYQEYWRIFSKPQGPLNLLFYASITSRVRRARFPFHLAGTHDHARIINFLHAPERMFISAYNFRELLKVVRCKERFAVMKVGANEMPVVSSVK